MAYCKESTEYNDVIDILTDTFGEVCSRDAIYSIVESCSGDLNHAADVVMSVTSPDNSILHQSSVKSTSPNSTNIGPSITKKAGSRNKNNAAKTQKSGIQIGKMNVHPHTNITQLPQMYEASRSKNKGTIPEQGDNSLHSFPRTNIYYDYNTWTEQMKRIVINHNKGARTLIFMRGAPGSGKTFLANKIQDITIGDKPQQEHIFSTDDYFKVNGTYKYNRQSLGSAHSSNQNRACEALVNGVSPVIIDNTNIELWEIQKYVTTGIDNGYILEVLEPHTPWARNSSELACRTIHRVPLQTIHKMLEKLKNQPMSPSILISHFNLNYPTSMQPPVQRCLPKILSSTDAVHTTEKAKTKISNPSNSNEQNKYGAEKGKSRNEIFELDKLKLISDAVSTADQVEYRFEIKDSKILSDKVETHTITENKNFMLDTDFTDQSEAKITSEKNELCEDNAKLNSNFNIDFNDIITDHANYAKSLEIFEKLEHDWDNGEAWDEDTNTKKNEPAITQLNSSFDAKLPRNKKTQGKKNSLPTVDNDNDWRKMYVPMPSLTDNSSLSHAHSKKVVETKSTETCVVIGDREASSIKNGFKILSTVARDINIGYLPKLPEKIPEKRMFDKSSMTNEQKITTTTLRCKNENKHFKRFRNMFKNLDKEELRDVFDKCCGDVNWAVSIVLDDNMANKQFESNSLDEQSELEEDSDESCDCIAHYDIIPDVTSTDEKDEHILEVCSSSTDISNLINTKQKKDSPISDTALALKRQIEKNIFISDLHYSEECLKVRKMRRGELYGDVSSSQNLSTGITMQNTNQVDVFSTLSKDSSKTDDNDLGRPSEFEKDDSDESDDEPAFDEVEKTVTIHLGYEFLNQLDTIYGRTGMGPLDKIEPKIDMPMSMLNAINALWMQSLMCQLEAESKSYEDILKQDEEFARELEMKELEISKLGKEPEVPNLKEIMDIQSALKRYENDCEEAIENDRPTDLATKLSLKKLYDLFPGVSQRVLDEIYMAHHYDFRTTVMVLLESQGKTEITELENGVDKFIMAQELKRQEIFLIEERDRLLEEKWPIVPTTVIDMTMVEEYRKKAKEYWAINRKYFKIANNLLNEIGLDLAKMYKNLSDLYMFQSERANFIAVAALLQISGTNDSIDLHYYRVREAMLALDIFLDTQIQRHREPTGKRFNTVYVITGRGLHSGPNGPVIKPQAIELIKRRRLQYSILNPGLLSVNICARDLISSEIS